MTKRPHYTNSWLEKTINKDFSGIVHAIVMETFCGFPNKKLKRTKPMENLTEGSTRSSSCSDSAYATSEDDLQKSSSSFEEYSLIKKLNSSVTYFREDSPCFESDDETLVDDEEFSSGTLQSFYQKRKEDDKDSLLYESHESSTTFASIEKPDYPEKHPLTFNLNASTCLLETSKLSSENLNKNDKEQSIADSSINSRDVSCLLESSNFSEDETFASKFNYNKPFYDNDDLQYEETIGKIYFEENRIEQLHNLLGIGKRQSGYIGSIPHLAAASKMLMANLTREALIASIAKSYFVRDLDNKIARPKGQIVVENIQLDTDYLGIHGNLPPCYYLVVLQHNTTVLQTQIVAPDAHGLLDWKDELVFDDVSHDFTIIMSLYKLQLKPSEIKNHKWKQILKCKRQQPPLFELVGKKQIITKSNIHKTEFEFANNEQLYADFKLSIQTGKNLEKTPMKLSKVVMKNNRGTKMISNSKLGQLHGTNLKLFQGFYNTQEPDEVISLVQCKRCRTYMGSINTLEIDYEKTHSSGIFYLTFETSREFREWRMALNGAILVAKKWNL